MAATSQNTQVQRSPTRERRQTRPQRPQLHFGRLALLLLVLLAFSFYIGPLRQFVAQQDRYQRETRALAAAERDNTRLKVEVERLNSPAYIGQRALTGAMLVPPDTQVFVISGLPRGERTVASKGVASHGYSTLERIADLWRSLTH